MELIQSFSVDHTKIIPGIFTSRVDTVGGDTVTTYDVRLNGDGSSADIVSRGVARDHSYQKLDLKIVGNAECSGHTECDSIIMDDGRILAVPSLEANSTEAALIHEAAIGKIAGEQLTKLMTLGLTQAEAEEQIINGFLR